MPEPKMKKCKATGCNNLFTPSFSTLQKYCSSKCTYAMHQARPKAPINKVSKNRLLETPLYKKLRIEFLGKPDNKLCKIHGTNCTKQANTIEHTMGRKGFADDWARDNKISLYIDVRFWLPACNNCNLELENNPKLSQQHQLSKIHGGKKIR